MPRLKVENTNSVSEKKALYEKLAASVSEHKKALFEKVLAQRTRYISLMLENIYQGQNISAVLRTADLLGIQDIHIVENYNKYNLNPQVALGSYKWLNIFRYNQTDFNTPQAINNLKAKGYRIVATTPRPSGISIDDFDLGKGKAAFMLGTELEGLTDTAMKMADEFVFIPMYGFTESFNISVSAALLTGILTRKLRAEGIDWKLSEEAQWDIRIQWAKKVIFKHTPWHGEQA
jgi:tRNA (guanosine-2'-O-)-methyltransferase